MVTSPRLILSLSLGGTLFCLLFVEKMFCPFLATLPNWKQNFKEGVGVILSEVDVSFWFVLECELANIWENDGVPFKWSSVAPFCVSDRFPPSRIQSMFFCNFFSSNVTLNKLLSHPSVFILFLLTLEIRYLFWLFSILFWFRHI